MTARPFEVGKWVPRGRYRIWYYPGSAPVEVEVRGHWWPWPSDNMALPCTIYEGGAEPGLNWKSFQHETRHTEQYRTHGWLWVWLFHRGESEKDARSMVGAPNYPFKVEALP